MSQSLFARPKVPLEGKDLSDPLKFALRKRYSLSRMNPDMMDADDIGYLNGLIDAGIEDARTLKEMIEQHDQVEVWLE